MVDISRLKALFQCLTPSEQRRWLWLLPLTVVVAALEGLVALLVFAVLRLLFDADADAAPPDSIGASASWRRRPISLTILYDETSRSVSETIASMDGGSPMP